ncbi:MAG: DUF2304 domain-containing protein [Massiliimalia sp.]|jgi:hypothetical protein
MTIVFRCVLILASLFTMFFMLKRIRHSKVQIEDAISWIVFAFGLLLISIFPCIAEWMTHLLGIASVVNFVFLFVIFVLLIKLFLMTVRVSQLDTKVRELTQKLALDENRAEQKEKQDAFKQEENPQ